MPGLLAMVDFQARPDLADRFQRQLRASQLLAWHRTDRWHEAESRVALGRVDLGVLNPAPQPVIDADRRYVLVFHGEIYDRASRLQALAGRGVPVTGSESADLLLATFIADGLPGIEHLNGSFFFALWDAERETLFVGGDRYGNRPHYHHFHEGRFYLAPEVRGIVAGRGDRPALSMTGLATFLAMEHPFGDETFFEGVSVFPPGTFLALSRDGAEWLPYWTPTFTGADEATARPPERWLDEASDLFEQAVLRCLDGPVVVPLSGGTDSRTVAAFAGRHDFPVFTFGDEDSQDVVYARRVAARLGLEHHVFTLPPDYISRYAGLVAQWGEGMVSIFHAHDLAFVEEIRDLAPVVVYGMTAEYFRQEMLEVILAEHPTTSWQQAGALWRHARAGRRPLADFPDEDALLDRLAGFYWGVVGPAWAHEVLSPELASTIGQTLRGCLAETFQAIEGPSPIDRLASFNVRVRQRRFSNWGLKMTHALLEYRKPFDDYALVDFMLKTPAATRRQIQAEVLRQRFPAMAAIPRTGTGLPLDASWLRRAAAFGAKQVAQRLHPKRVQTFADPQSAIRSHARPFFEDVLLDPQTRSNGLFRAEGVERLLRAHMAGEVEAGSALCALATVELWRRGYQEVPGSRPAVRL